VLNDYWNYFKTANIYLQDVQNTDEITRNQILATKVFIILFLSSLISLVAYTGVSWTLLNAQIKNPSQSIFEKLYVDHSEVLTCACSQTSILTDKFVKVNVSCHQVI